MSKKIVKTINNEKISIDQCKQFESSYYKIGDINIKNSGDCYFINGKYYREETGKIVFDFRLNQYVMKNALIIEGIIGFDNNVPIIGEFSTKGDEILVYTPTKEYLLLDESLIKDSKEYREKISDGNYYHKSLLSSKEFLLKEIPSHEYKTSLPYDSKGITDQYLEKYNQLNPEISTALEGYSSILKDLSFGLEFETTKGFIPSRILDKTGLIPLRDGSISGIEYVTVPMSGAKGIYTLINTVAELEKRTVYDNTCALHLHLGNIPRTKEFILAFFLLTLKYQEEIFSLFPLYKKYNFGIKRKNYSKPFNQFEFLSKLDKNISSKNIDDNFSVLFDYLHQDYPGFREHKCDLSLVDYHFADKNGDQKWNIKHRYYFHNFIPLIFGNKQTIEFRIHTPTYEIEKILSFLFLNASLINFTIKNQNEILRNCNEFLNPYRNLSYIVGAEISTLSTKINRARLKDFIVSSLANRKDYIQKISAKGDIVGNENLCKVANYINWKSLLNASNNLEDNQELLETWFRTLEKEIISKHTKGEYSTVIASKALSNLQMDYSNKKKELATSNTIVW